MVKSCEQVGQQACSAVHASVTCTSTRASTGLTSLSFGRNMFTYIYIYIYIHINKYIYIYICTKQMSTII